MKNYLVETFKKLENQNIDYDFPVLYPNKDFFNEIKDKSILETYGETLNTLAESNYDVELFIKNLIENPYLSSFSNDVEFNINKEGSEDILFNSETLSDKKELYTVMEIYYTDAKYKIEDITNDQFYISSLKITLGNLDMYLVGSYLYVKGKINKDMISKFIYLD